MNIRLIDVVAFIKENYDKFIYDFIDAFVQLEKMTKNNIVFYAQKSTLFDFQIEYCDWPELSVTFDY